MSDLTFRETIEEFLAPCEFLKGDASLHVECNNAYGAGLSNGRRDGLHKAGETFKPHLARYEAMEKAIRHTIDSCTTSIQGAPVICHFCGGVGAHDSECVVVEFESALATPTEPTA